MIKYRIGQELAGAYAHHIIHAAAAHAGFDFGKDLEWEDAYEALEGIPIKTHIQDEEDDYYVWAKDEETKQKFLRELRKLV